MAWAVALASAWHWRPFGFVECTFGQAELADCESMIAQMSLDLECVLKVDSCGWENFLEY